MADWKWKLQSCMILIIHPWKVILTDFQQDSIILKSDQKELFLRFAACFGQFLMAKDFQISYKNLPLKLYELNKI